jgi:hypothetical protein
MNAARLLTFCVVVSIVVCAIDHNGMALAASIGWLGARLQVHQLSGDFRP